VNVRASGKACRKIWQVFFDGFIQVHDDVEMIGIGEAFNVDQKKGITLPMENFFAHEETLRA
jgi:hypothetical protein